MKVSQSTSKPALITTPNDTKIHIVRTFDAPRDLVFRAYTDAKLLSQWMGPRKYKMIIEQMDVRPGGRWHFTHIDTDGTKYGFHGEFREIVRPQRIVQTWNFERKEHRDGMLASNMESGMNEGYDRLDELLRTTH